MDTIAMRMPSQKKRRKLWFYIGNPRYSQSETEGCLSSKPCGGCAKGAPLSQKARPKLRQKKKYLRIFIVLPKWDLYQNFDIFYKDKAMTVTATNVIILGAVFMFAARVFMGF
ncbi:hypothetical protein [Bdellovibrio sp. NC01]|uniref:hypothetical protein n=1 Tax=Bdellovibrio sp. NC01 TaxID=2220073 RepID=UPI0011571A94|nr:hypothetical protein [Bdellovibrio sp. NC01]QDK38202.1 hypothetical protein DOE51_11710 [Bdellovibrio sp. NC01]